MDLDLPPREPMPEPPRAARVAGLASLLLWAAVVMLGRRIGFTKGYDLTVPADLGLPFPG